MKERETSADPLAGGPSLPFFGQLQYAADSEGWNQKTISGIFTSQGIFMIRHNGKELTIRPIPHLQNYQPTDKLDVLWTNIADWGKYQGNTIFVGSFYCKKTHRLYLAGQVLGTALDFPSDCIVRRFGLMVLRWNRKSGTLKHESFTDAPIDDAFLSHLPVTSATSRFSHLHQMARFVRERQRVFCLISPVPEVYSCLLVYVYWRGAFVPVSGNYKSYPALHVFPSNSFLVWSINCNTMHQGLYLGVDQGFDDEGLLQFDISRISLRW